MREREREGREREVYMRYDQIFLDVHQTLHTNSAKLREILS